MGLLLAVENPHSCIAILETELAQDSNNLHALVSLADLLEDLGDPRGKFMALQIAKEREVVGSPRWQALHQEAHQLLMQNYSEWMPSSRAIFKNGVLYESDLRVEQYLSLLPIDRTVQHLNLRVRLGDSALVEQLAEYPAMQNLRTLNLQILAFQNPPGEILDFIRGLLSSPYLERLRSIRGHHFLQLLLPYWKRLGQLTSFDVDLNYPGVEGLLGRVRDQAEAFYIHVGIPNFSQALHAHFLIQSFKLPHPKLQKLQLVNSYYKGNDELLQLVLIALEFNLENFPSLQKVVLNAPADRGESVFQRLQDRGIQVEFIERQLDG